MVLRGERISNDPDLLDNLQAWVEHDYDTRLLHANLSFPLLKKLADLGDDNAKKTFKKELINRYSSGVPSVQKFLKNQGYMEEFSNEEMMQLSLCDEHLAILKEIASEAKKDVISLFHQSDYAYKKIVGLGLSIIEHLPVSLLKLKDSLKVLEIKMRLKEIPDWIGQFENLRAINFLATNISNIPKSIVKLKFLKVLSIRNNNLNNLPEYIGELKSLEILDLGNNNLNALPESISNLSHLILLHLNDNKFENIPSQINQLKSLEKLDLSKNNLSSLPESLDNLLRLRILDLNNNKFEEIPPQIKQLKSLESLGLARNPLKEVPKLVLNLPSLSKIWVRYELEQKYRYINPKLIFLQ